MDDTGSGRPRRLVTGGAGFIGSHLTRAFAADGAVTVYDSSRPAPGERAEATYLTGDVRDEEPLALACADADLVSHHAAIVSVARSVEAPVETHEVNARGTVNVLEAARKHDARVVFASSAAIYGPPETTPIAEDHPTRPTSPYGLDKLAGDHYVRLYHELYGLETVSLRYFNVYGPGQVAGDYAGVISVFVDQALADEPITVHGDGEQTRDFVYVEDVVRANRLAAETDAVGEAFHVATGEATSIRELAELVQELTDTRADIVHTEPREGDIEHSVADVSKARDRLGFEPRVSFREGLERTIEWYREYRT